MDDEINDKNDTIEDSSEEKIYINKLIHLIEEFTERLKEGTQDPEHFLTISEIERLWGEVKGKTNDLYSKIVENTLSQINETVLVNKKKQNI